MKMEFRNIEDYVEKCLNDAEDILKNNSKELARLYLTDHTVNYMLNIKPDDFENDSCFWVESGKMSDSLKYTVVTSGMTDYLKTPFAASVDFSSATPNGDVSFSNRLTETRYTLAQAKKLLAEAYEQKLGDDYAKLIDKYSALARKDISEINPADLLKVLLASNKMKKIGVQDEELSKKANMLIMYELEYLRLGLDMKDSISYNIFNDLLRDKFSKRVLYLAEENILEEVVAIEIGLAKDPDMNYQELETRVGLISRCEKACEVSQIDLIGNYSEQLKSWLSGETKTR